MSTVPAHSQPRSRSTPAQASSYAASAGEDTKLWLLRAAKAVVVFVYVVLLVDLVMLTLGFFLRLFGASTEAEFTQWVYRGVDRIMEPFRGIFPSHEISDQSILDVSLLFAMIVYTIATIAVHALVVWLTDKIVIIRRRQRLAQRPGATPGGPIPPPTDPAAGTPSTRTGSDLGDPTTVPANPRSSYP